MQEIVAQVYNNGATVHGVSRKPDEFDMELRERLVRWLRYYMEKYAHQYETQISFAHFLGVTGPAINQILSRKRTPGLDFVAKMHRRLHISIDLLVGTDPPVEREEKPSPNPTAAFSGMAAPGRRRKNAGVR